MGAVPAQVIGNSRRVRRACLREVSIRDKIGASACQYTRGARGAAGRDPPPREHRLEYAMSPSVSDFEKLGQFFLGKSYDLGAKTKTDELVMYDSKDLVTHAVCVGMTGSGKTGLCLGLLEEAAIDGIPAIIIDPKGDLSNLLLTFPSLQAEDFRPWINEDDARRKGLTPDDFAAAQAALWSKGLAEWGQSGERIQKLRDAAEFAVYTPGSSAGLGVSILKSFAVPPEEILEDGELCRERIASTATSLLGLLKINADPLQSREHILLSAIIGHAWAHGQDLDIPALIHHIQQPPFAKLGVMELESVYPSKERFGLAMGLNNLVASPGFGAWLEGEPLDIQSMLFTPQGKPRHAIFSIAHLGDAERMFFVSLLMNQILGWVRTQSGTTSLRAIVYMDEIAGYFPPVANPPSKQPMLTLMKQARAFGVGMVLATQNPVDLDYKGLANAGTWFIGRLQTDRDKQRVLDGLEAASAQASTKFDRASCDRLISGLESRVFLMNNVHEDGPILMQTRWCLSYLRGPLTRNQIKQLMDPRRSGESLPRPSPGLAEPRPPSPPRGEGTRPVLPAEIPQYFLPVRGSVASYEPRLMASGKVYYSDTKLGVDMEVPVQYLVPMGEGPVVVDWDHAEETDLTDGDVEKQPIGGATFGALPAAATKASSYVDWKKGFTDTIYRLHKLEVLKSPSLGEASKPGESERDFRARLAVRAREVRDEQSEKLRVKYASKFATLQDRLRRAEQNLQKQKEQSSSAKMGTMFSIGTAVLGAFLGRKTISASSVSKVATAARSGSRAMAESKDVGRAEETLEAVQQQLAELQAQFEADVQAATSKLDPAAEVLEEICLKPKKTNITVRAVMLAWAPMDASGQAAW